MTTQNTDPYTTPQSDVQDASSEQYGEVKVWSFSGRIGRLRYLGYSMALVLVLWFGGGVLAAVTMPAFASGNNESMAIAGGFFMVLIYGLMLVASFTLAVRRINDFGYSGWLSLLLLVPIANFIMALLLWFMPGTHGENKYGLQPPPRKPKGSDSIENVVLLII